MKLYRFTCISILICFAIGSLFVATEYVVCKLGFNAGLGDPITKFIIPWYPPWSIIGWTIKYYNKYPAVFGAALYICSGGLLSGFVVMVLTSMMLLRHSNVTSLHGTARTWYSADTSNNDEVSSDNAVSLESEKKSIINKITKLIHEGRDLHTDKPIKSNCT